METRRASMRDVARVSGLSLQTVSRVANGEPNVNEATRERVLGVMRDLDYRPNLAARAMRRGSFKTIGIVYQGLHAVGTRRTVESVSEYAALGGVRDRPSCRSRPPPASRRAAHSPGSRRWRST